jgi:hypothetical protein
LQPRKRAQIWLATLLAFAMSVYVGSALAIDSRMEQRAAEMPLPDPYLDPTWPEEAPLEGLGERYEAGDSDSVEDIPLDDEAELQAEQQALQALTGGTPATEAGTPPPAPPASDSSRPFDPALAVPGSDGDEEILPGDDHRDPVEW